MSASPRWPTTNARAVQQFLRAATWLEPADAPTVVALRKIAQQLDTEANASLWSQYRHLLASLDRRKGEEPPADPDEDLLAQVEG